MTDKEQQLQWLTEIYPKLERIAQAIIIDSATAAEDTTSNAVTKVLIQIEKGKHFDSKAKFCAYVRLAIRRCASEYYTKYKGDVVRDQAKINLINTIHDDWHRTPVFDIDTSADDFDPYERYEEIDIEEL